MVVFEFVTFIFSIIVLVIGAINKDLLLIFSSLIVLVMSIIEVLYDFRIIGNDEGLLQGRTQCLN